MISFSLNNVQCNVGDTFLHSTYCCKDFSGNPACCQEFRWWPLTVTLCAIAVAAILLFICLCCCGCCSCLSNCLSACCKN
uniref:Uncharacterized protein n=1 Tax=Trichobilharzia regenti TaxID=157069 RepID=A0AA85J5E4_TRIRE|nr:unnamed protein product [Trichobilharzia regenti]